MAEGLGEERDGQPHGMAKKLLHVADAAEDPRPCKLDKPRGSMYTSIVELGPQTTIGMVF